MAPSATTTKPKITARAPIRKPIRALTTIKSKLTTIKSKPITKIPIKKFVSKVNKQPFINIENMETMETDEDNSLSIGEITNIIICVMLFFILAMVIIYKFVLKRKLPRL
jgi:hypothetical protein